MKVCDIQPFIRFSQKITCYGKNKVVAGADYRITYLTDGQLDITVKNTVYTCTENTLFYCSASTPYSLFSREPVYLNALNFDLDQKNTQHKNPMPPVAIEDFNTSLSHRTYVSDSSFLNEYVIIPSAERFYPAIKEIINEYKEHKIFYQEKSAAILKELLIDLHRDNLYRTPESANAVNMAIDYIKENYSKDINNSYLAKLCGYHEYHLNRIFSKHTNMSIHKYISALRLNEAQKLLINTELPIEIISEKVGFNSNTSFSIAFKKQFGTSPNQYRKKFKNYF